MKTYIRKEKPKSVYLAGKIARNDWRHRIVEDGNKSVHSKLRNHSFEENGPYLNFTFSDKLFRYVGPFFVACDHSCYHGRTTHGVGNGERVSGGWRLSHSQTRDFGAM